MIRKGWQGESHRHSLASRKIRSCGKTKLSQKAWINYLNLRKKAWSEKTTKELDDLALHQDEITTSDLQGIVMTIAMKELNNKGIDTSNGKNVDIVMDISNLMLEYVYEEEYEKDDVSPADAYYDYCSANRLDISHR